jgi:hypothetical protein
MTREELRDLVWAEMPLLRSRLVGRERMNRVVDLVIDRAPLEVLPYVDRGSCEEEVVMKAWQSAVKMRYCTMYGEDAIQFGPLFWIVVAPLIQYAIQAILKWWLESRSHRVLMAGWRKEGLK